MNIELTQFFIIHVSFYMYRQKVFYFNKFLLQLYLLKA